MKKLITLVLALVCVLAFAGCNSAWQEQVSKYSFYGENEYFVVTNGVLILNSTEEVFEGGDLEVTQTDFFKNVASFSTSFYTIKNGEQRTILSNSVVDMTGGAVNVNGGLGKISGDGVVLGNKANSIDELKENLWFELKTMDTNGKENAYQLKLTLTEVTVSPNE